MPNEPLSQVLVMHVNGPMRRMLNMALTDAGYTVSEAPSYTAVLCHLHAAAAPVVVVSGNWAPDFHAEQEFFGRIAADGTMARRHRFVLLTTIAEHLPDDLYALLRCLGVVVLRQPTRLDALLDAVGLRAGRTPAEAEDESAGW